MAFVDVKTATFQIREKGLDMWTLLVQLHGLIQVGHIGEEIERLLIRLLPDRQQAHWAILFSSDPGRRHGKCLAAWWAKGADVERDPTGADADGRGGAADVAAVREGQISLQVCAIELALPQKGDTRSFWHHCQDRGQQFLMHRLRKMAFLSSHEKPAQRQGA